MQVDWEWGTVKYKTSNYMTAENKPQPTSNAQSQKAALIKSAALAAQSGQEPPANINGGSEPNRPPPRSVSPNIQLNSMCFVPYEK